jgi:integrase
MTMRGRTEPKRRARKRADGEGSIRYSEGKKLWIGRVMVGYRPDGKPDIREVAAKQQADCRKKLDAIKTRAGDGTLGDAKAGRETVAAFLPRWLEAIEGTIRPSTLYRYGVNVEKHLIPIIGRHKLSELRPEHIVGMLATLRAKEKENADGEVEAALAPRTVKYAFTTIRKALAMAVEWGVVPRNVAAVVKAPRVPKVEIHPPSPAEVRQLIDAAEASGSRFAPFWMVAVRSGARVGELLALQWRDANLSAGTISIRRTLAGVEDGAPIFHEPKTVRSRRTVRLSATALEALRVQQDRQAFDKAAYGDAYTDHGLVFPSRTGTATNVSTLNHRFKEALKRAGLPDRYRIHDLRHAAATAMLKAGIHPKVASERLGHASVAITLDLYSHLVEGLDADAAERMEAVFREVI